MRLKERTRTDISHLRGIDLEQGKVQEPMAVLGDASTMTRVLLDVGHPRVEHIRDMDEDGLLTRALPEHFAGGIIGCLRFLSRGEGLGDEI